MVDWVKATSLLFNSYQSSFGDEVNDTIILDGDSSGGSVSNDEIEAIKEYYES